MEDLEIVERVGNNKSKKTKLGVYTPSNLIKTTHKPHVSNIAIILTNSEMTPHAQIKSKESQP